MLTFQRYVFAAIIPLNLLCIVWVWFGRTVFGVGGWMVLLLTFVAPILLVALGLTTVLAFVQRIPYECGWITPAQAVAHVIMWTAMICHGGFLVDFGDAPESDGSVLTQIIGRSDATLDASALLAMICAVGALACYVWLLVLLLIGVRNRPKPPAASGPSGPFAVRPGQPPPRPPAPPWG
ncbi:MAG: hypothetical protein L0K86_19270 [Actinomycetia bacterium]|nr:hypothetical protein [Actinomycetes bacterium]